MVPETDVNTKEESGHLVFTVYKIDRTKSGNHCSHTELDEFPADSIQISSQALVIRTCSANRLPHAAAPGEKDVRRPTLIANLLPCLLGKIWSNLGIWGIHGQRIRQSSNMVQLGKHQVTDFFFLMINSWPISWSVHYNRWHPSRLMPEYLISDFIIPTYCH